MNHLLFLELLLEYIYAAHVRDTAGLERLPSYAPDLKLVELAGLV